MTRFGVTLALMTSLARAFGELVEEYAGKLAQLSVSEARHAWCSLGISASSKGGLLGGHSTDR